MEYPKGPFKREISMFRDGGGVLRTSHALKKGVSPRNLYAMREAGILVADSPAEIGSTVKKALS